MRTFGFVLLALLALSPPLIAQSTSYYTFSSSLGTYTELSGATVHGTYTNDDNSFNAINIGFTFNFNNTNYTQISIQTNGFLAFGGSVANSYNPLSMGSSNNVISALGGNLLSTLSGSLSSKLEGSSPNRIRTVQWKGYKHSGATTMGSGYNFQIKLYETSNRIEICYGSFSIDSTGQSYEVGLRGANNTDYNNRQNPDGWSSSLPCGSVYDTCYLSETLLPIAGLTYAWQPPVAGALPYPAQPISPRNWETITALYQLSWVPSGNVVTGYYLYLGTDNPPTNIIDSLDVGNVRQFSINQVLLPNQEYHWRVVPYNAVGSATECPMWTFYNRLYLPNQHIIKAEYFYNTDPGEDNGIQLGGTYTIPEVTANIVLDIPPGADLYVRFKSSNGFWSPACCVTGQQAKDMILTTGEYFLNSDPGLGLGTPIPSTYGNTNTSWTENLALTPDDALFIRFKSLNGQWSPARCVKGQRAKDMILTTGEYFINNDPGLGLGTPIPATYGTTTASWTTTMELGANDVLYTRFKSLNGEWSPARAIKGYVAPTMPLVAGEYFFDTDPGEGNGIPVLSTYGTMTASANFNVAMQVNQDIYIRFKNRIGFWGPARPLNLAEAMPLPGASLVYAEYYVGSDPGRGNGTPLTIGTNGKVQIDNLQLANHDEVHIRMKDSWNRWSEVNSKEYNFKAIISGQYKYKYASGSFGDVQSMTVQSNNDPFYCFYTALLDTPITDASVDSVYFRIKDSEHLYSKWYAIDTWVPLAMPSNLSPQNNSHNTKTSLLFEWNNPNTRQSEAGIRSSKAQKTTRDPFVYVLQVCSNPGFSNPEVNLTNLNQTSTSVSNLNYGTLYHWRVKVKQGVRESPWSEVWQFNTREYLTPNLPDPLFTNEDTLVAINLLDYLNELPGDILSFGANDTEHLDIGIQGETLTINPAQNWFGSESITLNINWTEADRQLNVSPGFTLQSSAHKPEALSRVPVSQTIVVTVNPVNDPPQLIQNIPYVNMDINSVFATLPLIQYFSDVDSPISFSVENNGSMDCLINPDFSLRLSPQTDWFGLQWIKVIATDDQLLTAEYLLRVAVRNIGFFAQNFNNGGSIPSGWTKSDLGTTQYRWQAVLDTGSDYSMQVRNTIGRTANESLVSPYYNFAGKENVEVSYYHSYLPGNSTSIARFQYSYDGVTWNTLASYSNTAVSGVEQISIANSITNNTQMKFRWWYYMSTYASNNGWTVDDFRIDYDVRDNTPPTQITDLLVTAVGNNSVTLSWTPPQEPYFARYEFYYANHAGVSTADTQYSVAQNVLLQYRDTHQIEVAGLAENTYYWFILRGVDIFNNVSAFSNEVVSVVISDPPLCESINPLQDDPPYQSSRTVTIGCRFTDYFGIDPNSVQYRFDENGNGQYDPQEPWINAPISRDLISTRTRESNLYSVSVTFQTDGNQLHYEFRASDVQGYGPSYSGFEFSQGIADDWYERIDTIPPLEISDIGTSIETGATSIEVMWIASEDANFCSYEVYYSDTAGVTLSSQKWDKTNDPVLAFAGSELVSTTITGLEPGTTYYFRVRAVDIAGNACPLTYEVFASTSGGAAPQIPQNVQISQIEGVSQLVWNPVIQDTYGNPITVYAYLVYASNSPNFVPSPENLLAIVDTNTYQHLDSIGIGRIFYRVTASSTPLSKMHKQLLLIRQRK